MTPAAARMNADDRRDQVIDAALIEFAESGLAGTSTEAIAVRAGISQPYLFKMFGTKRALFSAASPTSPTDSPRYRAGSPAMTLSPRWVAPTTICWSIART